MLIRYLKTNALLNTHLLNSNIRLIIDRVNNFSSTTVITTEDDKKKELSKQQEQNESVDNETENETNKEEEKKEKERYAVNTYPNNPPGLMEFFDDPKNWAEDYIKSGRAWKVEELRIKSNSDLHKLWYVLLKERNMLLTMEEAYKRESQRLPSEERVYKVNESMKNLEQVVRERNKAYWQLEVDQNETGERPVAFRRDIYGRYRWITCSEHFVPMQMNKKWKIFSGQGSGRNINEFMRRYREKQTARKASILNKQAFEVRQLMRRFPNMDLEVLEEKYPEINIEAQKNKLDDDHKLRKVISRFFNQVPRG